MNVDLNADVGEGLDDAPLFAIVTSVNIACGAHAGDEATMRRAVEAARAHGVAIGAHPGYPDREGMGRSPMALAPQEITRLVAEQVDRLASMAGEITHVKPHGALYNQAAEDAGIAAAIIEAVAPTGARVVGLAGSALARAGRDAGVPVAEEGFADRRYTSGGTLVPRADPNALIADPAEAAAQALSLAARVDTICVHADSPGALAIANAVRAALEGAGIAIAAPR